MLRQRGARSSRGERHGTLQALQEDLQRLGLQDVLCSLPTPDSFHFNRSRKKGDDTIALFLGNRANPNGSTCQAWARIVPFSEREDNQPPLLFYDQEFNGTRTVQYPRSASSLLRKAAQLLRPFCFLQLDSIDEATNVREMLSAIILYVAATSNVDASAWQWDKFGDSLVQALRYIDSRGAFHEWRHGQKLAALADSNPIKSGADVRETLEPDPIVDQVDNPATEEAHTTSNTNNGRYLGGTVRSRGSAATIRPNTSLSELKRELGDRKFKMLDKIPPKPMTISRHDIGGSLFPFRLFVGTAAYQETGEVIDVYAYIDHEGGKTSMYFMSHDKTDLEQIYDVNDMRDGVDLVQPLEYLNNLKKESYKDDAKSARTAKLRSLISYYFFVAENKGLIGNPGIGINEGFCKRLCAVCKELGMEEWGNDDDGGDREDQDDHRKDTKIDRQIHSPAQHAHALIRGDTEWSPQEEIDTEPSRFVRLRTRANVLSDAGRSKSIKQYEDVPDEDGSIDQAPSADVEDTATLELELRSSSQIAHGNARTSKNSLGDLMSVDKHPSGIDTIRASLSDERTMQSPLNTKLQDKSNGVGIDVDIFVSKCIFFMESGGYRHGEEGAPVKLIPKNKNRCGDALNWAQFGREACFPSNKRPPTADFLFGPLSVQKRKRTTKAESPQRHDPDNTQVDISSERVPADNPPHSPTLDLTRASSIASNKVLPASIVKDPHSNRGVPIILAAHIGGNRPPTPEGSAERDLKSQAAPTETPRTAPHAVSGFEAILISDDEDGSLALPAPGSVIDSTPEVRNQIREDVVDLTQLSWSPRGKKRKSLGLFHLSDSENDVIAETDGSEWHRKSRGRRK